MASQGVESKHRVFVTADGDLCFESDPAAAFLKYPVGAMVPLDEADDYNALVNSTATKQRRKMADK